jgi:predicted oxidoreductase
MRMNYDADVIVVGAGLAGLVAAAELAAAGRRVIVLDQEPEQSLGGQAFWSFGGLFLVDSPEQRRLWVKDSHDLALQDWMGSAGFDREEDHWPRRWAEAYVDFASAEKRAWLRERGVTFFPIVGWAERGGYGATGHGNSVPRFHIVWGTGPGLLEPFVRRVREAEAQGFVSLRFRHRVTGLDATDGVIDGVHGEVLEASNVGRGRASSRTVAGEFSLRAQAVVVSSGGIGGNQDLVRKNWPKRLGRPPKRMLLGVPAHVDGSMVKVLEESGARIINRDRMWHYTDGVEHTSPIWAKHGIHILPGPSSMWFDARGTRLPVPLFPGFDTLGTLEYIMKTGYDHTWFVLTQRIIEREFVLSGSDQNPDLTGKNILMLLKHALTGASAQIEGFMRYGIDFVVERNLRDLVDGMNRITDEPLIDLASLQREIEARDREIANPFTKDSQVTAIRGSRKYLGDKLARTVKPHRLLDPKAGPLIAVRLNIVTRKTLGGVETDLAGRVIRDNHEPLPGLYAAGEVAGFGGGGVHGYRALEGTFLGGCLFSGRAAGRAAAAAVR